MNIVEIALKRSVFGWVLMGALIIFGTISLTKLGISQMPDVNFPILNITINYDGAAPEVVESEIIDKVEERLLSVEGIKEMRASGQQGSATVTLEFDINRNVDVALQEVQAALSQLKFPTGVDPAIIKKSNPEEDPILIVTLYGNKSLSELMKWAEDTFQDQVQFIQGVGDINTGGFPDRNLRIWLDINRLQKLELTVNDVVDAVRSQHLESAAGQFVDGKQEIRVRYLGEAKTPAEIENFPIQKRGGSLIQDRTFHIKDVATVEDGLDDIRRIARLDNKTAVIFRIFKQRGTNEVAVADAVIKKLSEIKYPAGVDYKVSVNFTQSTKSTVNLTIEKLWAASLITIIVCFMFLGSFQSSLNILFSIPTSILGTFIFLGIFGFTLNIFTLLALTLSISIVVDDAIMILENIVRHHRMGKSNYQAAYDGAIEVLPAATAATAAVLAVFLPIIFMDGVVGKFLFQFGVTMSIAVILSLLEAITITPMRAAALLGTEQKHSKLEVKLDEIFENLANKYRNLLHKCIDHKYKILIASFTLFIASLLSVPHIKQEFVPQQDQGLIILNAQTKPGISLDETVKMTEPLLKILNDIPEIDAYMMSVGPGQLFMPITLTDMEKRKKTHADIMTVIREKAKDIKGFRISMRDISARNLTTGKLNPIAFNLRGPDLDILNAKTQEMMKAIEDQKLGVDVDTDYRLGQSELSLVPNRDMLVKKGVSADAVSQILQVSVAGLKSGEYMSDGKRHDIKFKVADNQITSVDDIKKLYVRNNYGNMIRLSEVVDTQNRPSLQTINRINRQRAIAVYGNLYPGGSQSVVLQKIKQISDKILPDGYTFNLEGASAGFSSSFQSLYLVLSIGILVAYMILAVQFNSFRDPISVLMALPFSATGAFLILWMTGTSLNLFSFIGLIVLMGIAKKNSIMLVEFTTQVRHEDKVDFVEALLKACPVRLRPILMTSAATVLAAAPLVFGGGVGHETRLPMGLVIIGGTIVSTAFTLFVVPLFYLVLNQIHIFKKKTEAH
ncbi:MAG: efflux RND transporter permease subunit [Pseudobdellovibrio sp.]